MPFYCVVVKMFGFSQLISERSKEKPQLLAVASINTKMFFAFLATYQFHCEVQILNDPECAVTRPLRFGQSVSCKKGQPATGHAVIDPADDGPRG
jgi:hypothetical protein